MNNPVLGKNLQKKRLKNKVVMIIHGLSESGCELAVMLAKEGADVAIVDFVHHPPLAQRICQEVEATGQRCLVLTSDTTAVNNKSFMSLAINYIIQTLGSLDTFVSYSAAETPQNRPAPESDENGRSPRKELFDEVERTIPSLHPAHTINSGNE